MKSSLDNMKPDRHTLTLISLGLVAILLLAIAIFLRQVLTPVIIALVIAYIADPLLSWLERRRVRRGLATTILYILVLTLLTIAGATLGPKIWNQAQRLYQNVSGLAQDYGSTMLESDNPADNGNQEDPLRPKPPAWQTATGTQQTAAAESKVDDGNSQSNSPAMGFKGAIDERLPDWGRRVRDYLRVHAGEIASRVASLVVAVGQNAVKGLSNAAGFLFGLVLVLVFTFFFMLHFHEMIEAVERYIPAAYRQRTLHVVGRIDGAVSLEKSLCCRRCGSWPIKGPPAVGRQQRRRTRTARR